MQNIYLLSDPDLPHVADAMKKDIHVNEEFESPDCELTEDILRKIATSCQTEYFYVIASNKVISFPDFDFSFKPEEWDKEYVQVWNNEKTVRMFNKNVVMKNPLRFSDDAYYSGRVKLKDNAGKIYQDVTSNWDIIFLSYDEADADENFNKLKDRFPRIKRVQKIKGIYEAHKAAARLSTTSMFFVVDADAEVVPEFKFDFEPNIYAQDAVHIWHSKNPINDLEYGYGGVKLFPTQLVLDYIGKPIDFTTSVAKNIKVMKSVSNITKFNTDPFSTWRSAFRECVKLSTQQTMESTERLGTWCTVGSDRQYGDFAIAGANEGMTFGLDNTNQPEMLGLINDFVWLEKRFSN
jgi:hypothetical protein